MARTTHRSKPNQRPTKPRPLVLVTALAFMLFLTGACNGGSDNEAAASATPVEATSAPGQETADGQPNPTQQAPESSPTPVPSMTPVPTPTPDPVLVEAEEVAVAYFLAIHRIAADARNADVSSAVRLEAAGGPLENYAFRLINDTLEANDRIDFDEIRWEVLGSEVVNPNVGAVDVFICMQSSGEWRDFDTNEVTLQASSDPFTFIYEVRRDGFGSGLKVWDFDDTDDQGEAIDCELSESST